jgi:hypothetical protein
MQWNKVETVSKEENGTTFELEESAFNGTARDISKANHELHVAANITT